MSRADLARGTGLSRTTVSSLVADLIGSGARRRDHRPRHAAQGRQRPAAAAGRAERAAGGVAGVDIGHRHVRVAVADRTGAVLAEEVDARRRRRRTAPTTLDRAARMVRDGLRQARGRRAATCAPSACACPAPLDRRSARITDRDPAGLARPGPGDGAASAGSACRWSPTTTPTSARSPSSAAAPPAAPPTSSTSRSPAASAPGSCSAAGCTAAPPASPARSATSRSARTARSAGAATAAAWRPRSRRRGCSALLQPGVRRAARPWTGCSTSTPTATPAYAGCSATPAGRSAARWPTCATASTPRRSCSAARSAPRRRC